MDAAFTIEQTNAIELESFPVITNVVDYLGPDGEADRGPSESNGGAGTRSVAEGAGLKDRESFPNGWVSSELIRIFKKPSEFLEEPIAFAIF